MSWHGAHAQMPGIGGGGINIGGAHGRGNDSDKASPSCPPASNVDYVEDARDRLQTLRSRINPGADQIALWNRYDIAASRAIEDRRRWHNRDHRKDLNRAAPEIDGILLDELRDRTAALEDMEDAAKPLYAALSPDQKELANKEMPAILSDLAGNPVLHFDGS